MSNGILLSQEQLEFIFSPPAIRERAQKIFDLTLKGETNFIFDENELQKTVDFVLRVIHKNYPNLQIPFHSRWGHFKAGGVDRSEWLKQKLVGIDRLDVARAKLELAITSVLLDAGAGTDWSYLEESTQKKLNRSEGLGVASYYMFCAGVMSADRKSLMADQNGLAAVTSADLEKYFQVHEKNPLIGVKGRVQLLNSLSLALNNKKIFKTNRLGSILDYLLEKNSEVVSALDILQAVLFGFGSIWPARLTAQVDGTNVNLGDVWSHSKLPGGFESLVPIHKLSQWMSYSLIEPLLEAGIQVVDVEKLTGLAEYRNGGLLIDTGLLKLRNPENAKKAWQPDSEFILEWRALTVYLLDVIGAEVQRAIGKTPAEFPLAKVLEGGTWWAGRFIAAEKRPSGGPPLNIVSDGTVF